MAMVNNTVTINSVNPTADTASDPSPATKGPVEASFRQILVAAANSLAHRRKQAGRPRQT
jgi:hypothetical protein